MTTPEIKYSLATIDNPNFQDVRVISESDYSKYTSYISKLGKVDADDNLFKIIELNYQDLKQKINDYTTTFANGLIAGENEFEKMVLDINRLILNFLSSVRTYLDHTETRLKRDYGNDSRQVTQFRQETAKAYDNNFAYRFLYKLRNYSQHCGLPASAINFNSGTDNLGKPLHILTLSLQRDALLKNYDSWGTIVKAELLTKPEKFDIIPLLEEKINTLEELNRKINLEMYAQLSVEGNELMNLINETRSFLGVPCLIKYESKGDKATISISWFPFDPISKITGVKFEFIPLNKSSL